MGMSVQEEEELSRIISSGLSANTEANRESERVSFFVCVREREREQLATEFLLMGHVRVLPQNHWGDPRAHLLL